MPRRGSHRAPQPPSLYTPSRPRGILRVLEPGLELVAHLVHDAGRQTIAVPIEKPPHGVLVVIDKPSQRPRHRLDHHVIPVVHQQLADAQFPRHIPTTPVARSVEHDGCNQRGPMSPAVIGTGPAMYHLVGDLTAHPGRPCQVSGKAAHGAPAVEPLAELLRLLLRTTGFRLARQKSLSSITDS